uniref:Protein kinase domain-containing protein n=1 Tax=Strongyloides papillosus TaxID=174720 RepID=A0A0N5CHN6_STREA
MEAHEDFSKEIPEIIQDPITKTQYSRGELLGRGGFANCYLFTKLENGEKFVIREVACEISYLHQKRVIHRDIRPDNIFLTKDMNVKIGDFGNAVKDVDSVDKFLKASGTPSHLSPESLDGTGYSFDVGVWALGTTLYEMIVGHYPFDNTVDSVLYDNIKRSDYSIPSTVPAHTANMVRIFLIRDPSKIPTIEDVLRYDYLSSRSISKDHLRGYISGKPLAKTINQEGPYECNAMPPSRNKNIPKEDCGLSEIVELKTSSKEDL